MLTATDADGNSASASASITVTDATETPEVASLWLSQFGRAVAQHALDGIAARIADPRIPSSEGSSIDGLGLDQVAVALARPGLYSEPSLTLRSLLDGGAFTTTKEQDPSGGSLAFWGRAAHSTFDGAARDVALTGEVTTTMLGTDYARGKWLAGLAVTRSSAEGDYHGTAADGGMESTLTAAIPYGSLRISERFSIWGAAGYGVGDAKFESGGEGQPVLATDIDWTMGSFGTRGKLFGGRGRAPAVAVLTDALWARTESDRTPELAASQSDVTRLRLALEGSWNVTLENGGRLAPKLEVGARNDGGDAETGFGLEVGGGIAWSYPALGIGVDLLARTLVAHEDEAMASRGFSVGITADPDPSSELGPSFTLRQELGGPSTGGVQALLSPEAFSAPMSAGQQGGRLISEAAWGLRAFREEFVVSPHLSYGTAPHLHEHGLGFRLTPSADSRGRGPELSLGIKALRRDSVSRSTEEAVQLEARARW